MIDKKKTKALMVASAVLLGLLGVGASFLPQELLSYFDVTVKGNSVLLVKVLGGLYVGYALLNWMARSNIIGAIYSRPVAIGNFAHFLMAGIAMIKYLINSSAATPLVVLALLNSLFAVWFGYLLFASGKSCS
ncbi:hypothetical protein [Fodinibius halophilus]|uniref:Uncharacterized protein n=1 Tax=Fodinibius halophilus TaxID=1736908 RepID=A0A6M1T879_9BACT|nr:hypothetical protein [Fodinibius halophilus]NGP88823.1 hypothetical protein [Fodinibius halophilus]